MKKFLAILLCFIMLISTTCFAAGFSDLTSEHWAYKNVTNLVENGVINGYPDGTYRPENTITRGEFFKLMMTAAEGEELFIIPNMVAQKWTDSYMHYAENEGLMMDGTSIENVDDPITRLEMVVVLSKTAVKKNIRKRFFDGEQDTLQTVTFNDISELSEIDQIYIKNATDLGLINGYTDGSFKPNGYMTRAEVATIIYRFLSIK